MHPAIACVISGVLWGSWQLFARASGASPLVVSMYVSFVGLIPITIAYYREIGISFTVDLKQFVLLTLAGLSLGGGMVVYSILVTNKKYDLTIYIPIAAVLITAVVIAGGLGFFGETLTTKKIIGLSFALVAIWLLS